MHLCKAKEKPGDLVWSRVDEMTYQSGMRIKIRDVFKAEAGGAIVFNEPVKTEQEKSSHTHTHTQR